MISPAAHGGSEIIASTADAAAVYNLADARFSRERLSDTGINVGGQGGATGFLQAAVFPFQLPDFGAAAQPFQNAEFIFRLSNKESVSAFNADLYALPARASSGVLPSSASTTNRGDFFMGGFQSGPADDNAAGVVKLQDNILVPATPNGVVTTRYSGSTQLAAYLNAAYDGGNGAGKWVFLRLSTDALAGGANRYTVSSADHTTPEYRPRIRYNFTPEPETLYTRIGTDPTFQQLIDTGVIVPGVSAAPGPVLGSQIDVNNTLLESQTGNLGNIPTDIRIHTQVNSSVSPSNFPNFTRWYQEDGRIQVMRLFEGEQNVRSGVGPEGTPGRIEAFFPAFAVQPNTWSVWEGTYTIIDPLQSNIFQLFHEGGQLWAFHLRMTNAGTIYFSRRRAITGLPSEITIATNMVGKSISFMVRANGTQYELYKRTPLPVQSWELVTTGSYTPAVDRKISYRWGMYYGSQAGQTIPNDGLLFVNGIKRYSVDAPGGEPPPPPPPVPVTYYWDNNGATAGFGNAGGVWGETTSGGTQGWSTDTSGATLPEEVSTNAVDPVFFGTYSTGLGLGAGTITVSDTVDCADITFGSQSGNITLNGGEIGMFGSRVITVGGTGKTHTIRSVLAGDGSRTIAGGSTLVLTGENTFTGPLVIGDGSSSSLRLRISSIGNANGTPSAVGAPATTANGIIQIGSGSLSSTLELSGSTASQWTNRRIRIGSDSTGSGSATIQNNNANAAHTLTFTNSAFNVAATDTASFNRTLTLGGSNTGDNTIQGAIINNSGGTGGKVALAKSGSGTWALNGANTFTGNTSISSGQLQAKITQTASALSTSPVSVSAGATLVLDNQSTTNVADVPTIGNVFTGSGLLRLQFAAGTTARNTYLPNVTGFGGTIQLSNAGATGDKWNVADIGTVAGSLLVDSGSTIYLRSGTNTFSGGTTLNGPGNSEGRGAIRVAGATTIFGGPVRLAGNSTIGMENVAARITGNISSDAAGTQTLTLGGTQGSQSGGILSGNIGGGTGTIEVAVANGSYTLSGNLSHSGGVNIASGLLTLSGPANSYTGVTAVGAGNGRSLLVSSAGALGATGPGNETTVGANGQLGFSGGITYTAPEKIIGSGPGASSGAHGPFLIANRGFIQSVSGSNTFAGDIEVTASSRIGTQTGARLTLTGVITQTSGNILFRVGDNAGDFVTLANPGNSFGGDSTVFTAATAGNWAGVRLGASNALPTNLTISGFSGTGAGTALDLNGKNQTLNGLINGATLNIINLDTANAATLTLNPTADKSTTNTVIAGGAGLGVIHVVKDGTSTQTLAGTNTYSGTTFVNQGTLALVGASMASPITVAAGASLGFTLGAPATSTSSVDLTYGTVKITGSVDGGSDYLLITASGGITGTPVLAEPVAGYKLQVQDSGTKLVLAYVGGESAFESWSGGAAPDDDSNGDGVANAIAWALGAASPAKNARGLLPALDNTTDPGYLIFTFPLGNAAEDDPDTGWTVEYAAELAPWTTAEHDGDNVIISKTPGSPSSTVTVKLKRSTLAPDGTLFVRLKVIVAIPPQE